MSHKLSESEIFKLIELRHKYKKDFTGQRNSANPSWQRIIDEMGLNGKIDVEKVKKKYSNLLQKYKALKDGKTGVGTEDGEETRVTWPFFEVMDNAMNERPIITPYVLVASANEESPVIRNEINFMDEAQLGEEPGPSNKGLDRPAKKKKDLGERLLAELVESRKSNENIMRDILDVLKHRPK